MCVRYSPTECAEYGCATKIGTLLYVHGSSIQLHETHLDTVQDSNYAISYTFKLFTEI